MRRGVVVRRLVVSDIHGYARSLAKLLERVGYRPGADRLYLLGDFVDRGPDGRGTVELVMDLVRGGAVALLGNHEELLLKVIAGDPDPVAAAVDWVLNGGLATLASYGVAVPDAEAVLQFFPEHVARMAQESIPPDHVEFLASLPLYHEEDEYLFVHAGLEPGVPLAEQSRDALLWGRDPAFWVHPAPYGDKTVVFGHTPTPVLLGMIGAVRGPEAVVEPWFGPKKVAVDTGVYATGVLAAVELPDRFTVVTSSAPG